MQKKLEAVNPLQSQASCNNSRHENPSVMSSWDLPMLEKMTYVNDFQRLRNLTAPGFRASDLSQLSGPLPFLRVSVSFLISCLYF